MDDRWFPAWPERWEFFDGILKYDPEAPGDVGGELELDGVPLGNPTWIVGGVDDEDEPPAPA